MSKPRPDRPENYPHRMLITSRWMDNDIYGHVNNVQYYSFFDTVINRFLIDRGVLDIHAGDVIGLAVESHCNFFASAAFPQDIEAGLRVGHLGRSSVRYEVGLFVGNRETAIAQGHFVHVFVQRDTSEPTELPQPLRSALAEIAI